MEGANEEQAVSQQLLKVLNSHGHGFHYAVLRQAEQLFHEQESPWFLEATEFPVKIGSSETHIDFILRRKGQSSRYLVGECKRVNPAYSRWCFVRTPYTTKAPSPDTRLIFDSLYDGQPSHQKALAFRKAYNLGEEIKGSKVGDIDGSARGAINNAVTQVLRGSGGLLSQLSWDPKRPQRLEFVPVVFTTAELWTTKANLSEANLETGSLDGLSVERADWIWFNYNRSYSLRPGPNLFEGLHSDKLSESLEDESTRSVAIVSPSGLVPFLTAANLFD